MLASTVALAAAGLGVIQSQTLLGQARTLRRLGTAVRSRFPFSSLPFSAVRPGSATGSCTAMLPCFW